MANIYYVKSGGIATGDAGMVADASSRTGAFGATSTYYDSVFDVLGGAVPTTTFTAADRIFCSTAHDVDYGGSKTLAFPSVSIRSRVYSVDDSNQENYLAGATETSDTTGANSITVSGAVYIKGVNFKIRASLSATTGSILTLEDSTVTALSTADTIQASQHRANIFLKNVNFDASGGAGCGIRVGNGGVINWTGGAISAGTPTNLFEGADFQTGGGHSKITGVDLTAVTGDILDDVGSNSATDDTMTIFLQDCQMAVGTGFCEEAFWSPSQIFTAANSASTSDAREYQFFQRTCGGDVEDQDDAGIHRDESTAYPSGTKVSLKVTPVADCSPSRPVIFNLAVDAPLSGASTDTIRIYFVISDTETLTDQDVWAELVYPDGTNKQIATYLTNRNTDPIATGTTHTTDSSSTWMDGVSALTGHNEYQMDLDTSGDVGADCVPVVRIYVGYFATSKPIYFDTTMDVVA